MDNIVAKNPEDVEKYREKIFKSKEECRKIFAEEPFEEKIKTAFELYKRTEYLKKFKPLKLKKRQKEFMMYVKSIT